MSETQIREALEALEGVACESEMCPGPDGEVGLTEVDVIGAISGTLDVMAGPCGVCRAIQALEGARDTGWKSAVSQSGELVRNAEPNRSDYQAADQAFCVCRRRELNP